MVTTVFFTIAATIVAMGSEASIDWANHQMVLHQLPVEAVSTRVKHSELFFKGTTRGKNDFIAANGTVLDTAGSGSTWVYDPAHGIIAFSEAGDLTGDQIWYSGAPPFAVQYRDLSGVASPLGLHLGMSIDDALAILRLPATAVHTLPNGNRYIATTQVMEKLDHGANERVRENKMVFKNGRAIWIELDDACC